MSRAFIVCCGTPRKLLLLVTLMFTVNCVVADETARRLFEGFHESVFQVRVIDVGSGEKFSIGSGFSVAGEGLIATNFHVIAAHVHEPKKYRLEIIDSDGVSTIVSLKAIDVAHDLAIVVIDDATQTEVRGKPFELDTSTLTKGAKLYSMGNPHDLGMTIIEGNYNGLVQHVRHDNILFSGSLNPGMSGGPAFNQSGDVVGINVAKGQEQISFLVPVRHLGPLIEQSKKGTQQNFKTALARQLFDDQQAFYQSLLSEDFPTQALGDVILPDKINDKLNCWGHTENEKDRKYESVHRHCRTDDRIFVSNSLYLGHFSYDYEWNTTDELNAIQFYSAIQPRYTHGIFSSANQEKDVTEPKCVTKRMQLQGEQWKASTCLRRYKKLNQLYDMSFILNSISMNDRSILLKIKMVGISIDNAMAMQQRMMESISWKN